MSDLRKAAQDVVDAWLAEPSLCPTDRLESLRIALLFVCRQCGKPTPEGSIHTCSPLKPGSDAKQRLLEIMRRNGLATGHGDTIDDALKELDWQLSELKGKSDGTL